MTPTETPGPHAPSFKKTLLRVMIIQVVALLALWALQARYGG